MTTTTTTVTPPARIAEVLCHGASPDTTDPDDLDLLALTDEERYNLPAVFHRPVWYDLCAPPLWACEVCWSDGVLNGWPCAVAAKEGRAVAKAAGLRHTH